MLKPKKEHKVFDVKLEKFGWNASVETPTKIYNEVDLQQAIAYYQAASYLFENGKMKNE